MQHIHFKDGRNFAPGKIVAVGRNYAAHVKEMQSQKTKEPVLFLKPNSALCDAAQPIPIPQNYGTVHHEVELAVCLAQTASHISADEAMEYIAGYGLALDLTLRDMQSAAKKAGLPWAVAKGFDNACPVSTFVPALEVTEVNNLELTLRINGILRQQGNTGQMLFKIPELLAYASAFFTFEAGDILLTGTPAGVGPLVPGDAITASIEQVAEIKTRCIGK